MFVLIPFCQSLSAIVRINSFIVKDNPVIVPVNSFIVCDSFCIGRGNSVIVWGQLHLLQVVVVGFQILYLIQECL